MKTKMITLAGVTVAAIQTNLTTEMIQTVKKYNKEACMLFNEDKKVIFGLGVSTNQHVSDDYVMVNLENTKENLTFKLIGTDLDEKQKKELKVKLVIISKNIEKVEKQIVEAYDEYNALAEQIEEVDINTVEDELTEEGGNE